MTLEKMPKNVVGIVIPTLDRLAFLIRQLKYYDSVGGLIRVYAGNFSDECHIEGAGRRSGIRKSS